MFGLPRITKDIAGRTVEIGWIIDAEQAGLIWEAPRKVLREAPSGRHAKSVRFCPAALDHQARLFEVPCPIDLHLRLELDKGEGPPKLINVPGDRSTIRSKHLGQMVSVIPRKEWRDPNRPILQVATPYLCVADEPAYLSQLPPFEHFRSPGWPGVLISGRFPCHIWPRHLMWAFEWYDTAQELVLRRGEPWFYLRFETMDPSRPVRLIEADMTPAVREYVKSLSSVTNYVSRTFSLFNVARERRPKRLVHAKVR